MNNQSISTNNLAAFAVPASVNGESYLNRRLTGALSTVANNLAVLNSSSQAHIARTDVECAISLPQAESWEQQISAVKTQIPRIPLESGSAYARRIHAAAGHWLCREQIAEAAGITTRSLAHIVEFRGETPGTTLMRQVPAEQGETALMYGRRLKTLFPDFPNDDHVCVSQAARATLLSYPEFQRETENVIQLRQDPQAKRRQTESVKEWGKRLRRDYDLSFSECSRLCNARVGIFRSTEYTRPVRHPNVSAEPVAGPGRTSSPVPPPREDKSAEDLTSLSSSVSSLSLDDAALRAQPREKIWSAQPEKLPALLSELQRVRRVSPHDLIDWINREQAMAFAVIAVLGGQAERMGTLVMHETAEALLQALAQDSSLTHDVYGALFPSDREVGLRFVNTLPLLMHRPAGVKITRLLNILSRDLALRGKIKAALGKKYVADSPRSEEYAVNNDFYARVKIASQRITTVTSHQARKILKNLEINNELNGAKKFFAASLINLDDGGLSKPPSLLSKMLSKKRQAPSLPPEERKRLATLCPTRAVSQESPTALSRTLLQKIQQQDKESFSRWQANTESFRARGRQLLEKEAVKSAQQRQQAMAMSTAVAATLAAQNAHRAMARSVEKGRERDAEKEQQWQLSRAGRDDFNERMRHASPNIMAAAAGAMIDAAVQDMQDMTQASTSLPQGIVATRQQPFDAPQHETVAAAPVGENSHESSAPSFTVFNQVIDKLNVYFDRLEQTADVALPSEPVNDEDVERLLAQMAEEVSLDLAFSLPDVPLFEPGEHEREDIADYTQWLENQWDQQDEIMSILQYGEEEMAGIAQSGPPVAQRSRPEKSALLAD